MIELPGIYCLPSVSSFLFWVPTADASDKQYQVPKHAFKIFRAIYRAKPALQEINNVTELKIEAVKIKI